MSCPEIACCVVEEGVRCRSLAGYTTFDRRWLKSVSQKRQKYLSDPEVRKVGSRLLLLLVGSSVVLKCFGLNGCVFTGVLYLECFFLPCYYQAECDCLQPVTNIMRCVYRAIMMTTVMNCGRSILAITSKLSLES